MGKQGLKDQKQVKDEEAKEGQVQDLCRADLVKPGSYFSRHSFGEVLKVEILQNGMFGPTQRRFTVKNELDIEWSIDEAVLVKEFRFADQEDLGTKIVTRTEIIEVLEQHPGTAMQVCFRKAPDPAQVAQSLACGRGQMGEREWKKVVASQIAGEERMMTGRHHGSWDQHRRLRFHEQGKGLRLVDPRTIEWVRVARTLHKVEA